MGRKADLSQNRQSWAAFPHNSSREQMKGRQGRTAQARLRPSAASQGILPRVQRTGAGELQTPEPNRIFVS